MVIPSLLVKALFKDFRGFTFYISVISLLASINLSTAEEVKDLNLSFEGFQVITSEEENADGKVVGGQTEFEEDNQSKRDRKKAQNNLDKFFDKSLRSIQNIKEKGKKAINKATTPENVKAVEIRQNPAKKFPDPLFYDAIYNTRGEFITYAYVYNDKSNKDNNYIPTLKNYNIMEDLFLLSKDGNRKDRFYELFNSAKDDIKFNINKQDINGNTLLITSLRNGNFDVFNFLISQGANPNICNRHDICPVQISVFSKNLATTKALMDVNTDINIVNKDGLNIMQYVIYNGRSDLFKIVLKRYLRYPKNILERQSFIFLAEELGREDFVHEMRLNFNIYNESGS